MEHLKYSTGLKRVGAAIVDGIVFWPVGIVATSIHTSDISQEMRMALNYFFAALPVLYSVYCHYKYGMTIGKWVARIKVIDVNEMRDITLRQAFLRDIIWVTITCSDIIINYLENTYWTLDNYPEFVAWISMGTASAWMIWTLLEIISMLTNSKRRAIHDFIAGTVVVRSDVFERSKLMNESFKNTEGR